MAKAKRGARRRVATSAADLKRSPEAVQRRAKINADYAKRHPERARAERALRKAQAQATQDFSHKNDGKSETHAKAARVRQGVMARLYQSGGITIEQMASAMEIAAASARIGGGLGIRMMSMEARVDQSPASDDQFIESLGRVRRDIAYGEWRKVMRFRGWLEPLQAMITHDMALTKAAALYGVHHRTLKAMLCDALDFWVDMLDDARRQVDAADLAAMQSGLI